MPFTAWMVRDADSVYTTGWNAARGTQAFSCQGRISTFHRQPPTVARLPPAVLPPTTRFLITILCIVRHRLAHATKTATSEQRPLLRLMWTCAARATLGRMVDGWTTAVSLDGRIWCGT